MAAARPHRMDRTHAIQASQQHFPARVPLPPSKITVVHAKHLIDQIAFLIALAPIGVNLVALTQWLHNHQQVKRTLSMKKQQMFPELADIVVDDNLRPFISIKPRRQPAPHAVAARRRQPPPPPAVPNMAGARQPINRRVKPSATTIPKCLQRRLEVQWLLDNQPAGCNLAGLAGWANLYDQFTGTQLERQELIYGLQKLAWSNDLDEYIFVAPPRDRPSQQ